MVMQHPTIPSSNKQLATASLTNHPPPRLRCTQCSSAKAQNQRNIVVCIDGTSNQFGKKNTNVVKLFAKIDLATTNPEQCAYYSSGIGTSPKSLNVFKRMERAVSDKFGMAIAWNMEEIVKDAYGWLARTYREGDQIYLFGFSRGAYQVRVLAGMIHEVGLIRTPTEKQIGTAYDHYAAIRSRKLKTKSIAKEFKNTFSWQGLRVHFVGVWDTVSSVGIVRGDIFLSTSSSAAHACHFRHALALDERRVKFMPEYFHEMNSLMHDSKFKYTPACRRQKSTVIHDISDLFDDQTTEIKEVWFAGSHSDVGGRNSPGKSHQAGNVSLLWMRREAAESGLVLRPTDIVWVPDDLDFGTSDSMSFPWRIIEYLPFKYQTCFSGGGENTLRWHRSRPRRIIPGQKVHASILYANAYKPKATLGDGFDIPIMHAEPEDPQLDIDIWETGLFDNTAAQELLKHFDGTQGIAPIYLDRLLFMLRFKEGRQCIRKVDRRGKQFKTLVECDETTPLVKLIALVAYYETASDIADASKNHASSYTHEFDDQVFRDAQAGLQNIFLLALHKHEHHPRVVGILARVVGLLRPLTRHLALREHIMTLEVLESLVNLFDEIISRPGGDFGQAMDGLNCLLQCEGPRGTLVLKLKQPRLNQGVPRLFEILHVDDPHLLTAALRMVLTFAQTPEEIAKADIGAGKSAKATETKNMVNAITRPIEPASERAEKAPVRMTEGDTEFWFGVRRRVRKLTERKEGLVGRLAVQVLLALYDEEDQHHLNIHNAHCRANVAAWISLKPKKHEPGGINHGVLHVDPERRIFHRLFGIGGNTLEPLHEELIAGLQRAVKHGNAQHRTAATLTLLHLCEGENVHVRAHLCKTGLLNVFINQLKYKESALLAAYALATCLQYKDMKKSDSIKNNALFPKLIVGMLRMDYFDDAVGHIEGFQIFRDLLRHADLLDRIKKYKITEVLDEKLRTGKAKDIRTGLICLEIFLSVDAKSPWTSKLVDDSFGYLKKRVWEDQKAGVMILSALAQTDHGVKAIRDRIPELIRMLLPANYQPIKEGFVSNHARTNTFLPVPNLVQEPISESSTLTLSKGDPQPHPQIPDSPIALIDHRTISGWAPSAPVYMDGRQTRPVAMNTDQCTDVVQTCASSQPSSWMMGPACALWILAHNKDLRECTRKAHEYSDLKQLHVNEMLVSKKNTPSWKIKTPNRTDVAHMLDKMMEAVDEEISEEFLVSIGDAALPHIEHWDRLVALLRHQAVVGITILPAVLAVPALAALAVVLVPPFYLSSKMYTLFERLRSQHRNNRILDGLFDPQTSGPGSYDGRDAPPELHGGSLSLRDRSSAVGHLSGYQNDVS